jgi:DnaD/phage-associated family protein
MLLMSVKVTSIGLNGLEGYAVKVEVQEASGRIEIKEKQQQSALECAVTFFNENGFGNMGSYLQEKIHSWCLKLSGSLVVEAMKKAAEQGKQYWSYVEAILMKWEQSGVREVREAQEKELEFMKKKVVKGKGNGQMRKPLRT